MLNIFRLVRNSKDSNLETMVLRFRPNVIIVTESLPLSLPVCAALITSCVQIPLCHTAILCGNRGTPSIVKCSFVH